MKTKFVMNASDVKSYLSEFRKEEGTIRLNYTLRQEKNGWIKNLRRITEMNVMQQCVKERNEALFSLDRKKIERYFGFCCKNILAS